MVIRKGGKVQIMAKREPVKKTKSWQPSKSFIREKNKIMAEFCVIPTADEINWLMGSRSEIEFENKMRSVIDRRFDTGTYIHR